MVLKAQVDLMRLGDDLELSGCDMRWAAPLQASVGPQTRFCSTCRLLVERKRVVGPTEAWKGESSSYHILKWDHFERLLTVVKTIYQYS